MCLQRNVESRSRKRCRGKGIRIAFCVCVSVTLVIQRSKRVRLSILPPVACVAPPHFSALSLTARFSGEMLLNIK